MRLNCALRLGRPSSQGGILSIAPFEMTMYVCVCVYLSALYLRFRRLRLDHVDSCTDVGGVGLLFLRCGYR